MTKKQFAELSEKYSPEELAESFIFPIRQTKKQKDEADKTLGEFLRSRRATTSPELKLKGALLQLRFQIEDYLKEMNFDENKTFGYFLNYISTVLSSGKVNLQMKSILSRLS